MPRISRAPSIRAVLVALVVITPLLTPTLAQATPASAPDPAAPLPTHLRDRGTGVPMSQFGVFVDKGEILVYTFGEWYVDRNLEYKPSELGYGLPVDQRGRYTASEQLLWVAYGITPDLALELEAAHISAELVKSPRDTATIPGEFEENGLGDVEGQLRWRFLHEQGSRPEAFAFFESVAPLQKRKHLIGTQDWEFSLGGGVTRGYRWGTVTLRAATEYVRDERKFDTGEYAVEYLKRVSPSWKIFTAVEGSQADEVSLITEAQYQIAPNALLKLNNGWGLTTNATDFAPEVGVVFRF